MPLRPPNLPAPIVLALAIVLSVAACDASGSSPGGTPEPSEATDLSGTAWNLRTVGGSGVAAGSSPTIAFEAGRASGTTGCNSFGGEYAIDGSSIVFSPLAATKRGCEPALMDQESAVLEALASVTAWEIDDEGRLRLGGGTELVFDPATP